MLELTSTNSMSKGSSVIDESFKIKLQEIDTQLITAQEHEEVLCEQEIKNIQQIGDDAANVQRTLVENLSQSITALEQQESEIRANTNRSGNEEHFDAKTCSEKHNEAYCKQAESLSQKQRQSAASKLAELQQEKLKLMTQRKEAEEQVEKIKKDTIEEINQCKQCTTSKKAELAQEAEKQKEKIQAEAQAAKQKTESQSAQQISKEGVQESSSTKSSSDDYSKAVSALGEATDKFYEYIENKDFFSYLRTQVASFGEDELKQDIQSFVALSKSYEAKIKQGISEEEAFKAVYGESSNYSAENLSELAKYNEKIGRAILIENLMSEISDARKTTPIRSGGFMMDFVAPDINEIAATRHNVLVKLAGGNEEAYEKILSEKIGITDYKNIDNEGKKEIDEQIEKYIRESNKNLSSEKLQQQREKLAIKVFGEYGKLYSRVNDFTNKAKRADIAATYIINAGISFATGGLSGASAVITNLAIGAGTEYLNNTHRNKGFNAFSVIAGTIPMNPIKGAKIEKYINDKNILKLIKNEAARGKLTKVAAKQIENAASAPLSGTTAASTGYVTPNIGGTSTQEEKSDNKFKNAQQNATLKSAIGGNSTLDDKSWEKIESVDTTSDFAGKEVLKEFKKPNRKVDLAAEVFGKSSSEKIDVEVYKYKGEEYIVLENNKAIPLKEAVTLMKNGCHVPFVPFQY
ncbi:hypothetical protein IJG72_00690 [bacterium]|nr:hypothetical protein [bacterium]